MGKFLKTTLVFIGGMTAGGYCITNAAMKSPIFRTALKDVITNKAVEILYGSEDMRPKQKVSYYDIGKSSTNKCQSLKSCKDIVFSCKRDAEFVLGHMHNIVDQYGMVSLADLYDLATVSNPSYTASKYGWTSLDGSKIIRCRDGYFIDLPQAIEIEVTHES